MDLKSKIILISGPTASGKSSFAIKLAKKVNGEIINADSMQVYRELKILSARPSIKEQKNIKHHLYGFHSVEDNFSTGDWLKLTLQKIKEIKKIKKIPILVGGTGLYFKALTNGLVNIPNIPIQFKNKIRSMHNRLGQKSFYLALKKIDPLSKDNINPTDTQRSIRAYEVKKFTKKSLFEWFANTKSLFKQEDFIKIYIEYPRSKLISKINKRVERMIKSGAIIEVKKFKKMNVNLSNSSNKLIGINEIEQYLKEVISLEKMIELISIRTRQYAKRQSTWSRGQMKDWKKISTNNLNFFLLSLKLVQN
jgi:tRNA dimethylallyltransferase